MFDPVMINVGPLFLPLHVVAIALFVFISVWLAERLSPESRLVRKTVIEWLPAAWLMALVVYKFSPALFNLGQVWQNPAMLLYLSGTDVSLLLAILLTACWLAWKTFHSPLPWAAADVMAVSGLLSVIAYNVLFKDLGNTTTLWQIWGNGHYVYHPLHVYRVILLLPLVVWIFRKWSRLENGRVFSLTSLWIGTVYIVTSFADFHTGSLKFFLTKEQWAGVILALAGFTVKVYQDQRRSVSKL